MWGLLLTVACLAAPPDASTATTPADVSAPDEAQVTLRRVAQLPAMEQRDWLRHLEQRYNWASQITMSKEDAHRDEARVEKLLRQPNIPWADMVDLLHQTDQREKSAVSKLVRQYRKAVYNRYQTQPRTMQERQEAWYRVWSAWESAGSPASQQDRLLDWLADAIRTTTRETVDRLPVDPKFGPGAEGAPEGTQLAKLGPTPVRTPSQTAPRTPSPASSVEDRPLMLWRGHAPLDDQITDRLATAMPPAVLIASIAPRRMAVDETASIMAENRIEIRLPRRTVANLPSTIAESSPETNRALARHDGAVRIRIESPQVVSAMNTVAPEVRDLAQASASDGARDVPQLPGRSAVERSLLAGSKLDGMSHVSPDVSMPAREPAVASIPPATTVSDDVRRLPREEHVVASLPRSLLESALPPATIGRPVDVQNDSSTNSRAVGNSAETTTPASSGHAEVDVQELTSRIAGINLSLRTLEGELSVKRTWSVDQLDSLVQRLDILILRQKDLSLFRDLITPIQRARTGAIDSPKAAIAALMAQVGEMRVHYQTTAPAADDSERSGILRQLETMSDRLSGLANEGIRD